MSLENEDHNSGDQPTEINHESQKKLTISYTRDFLLSLRDLDVCKKLPSGFDQSLLSEFEDSFQDRQRSYVGLSAHNFRRSEYGTSPPTGGDMTGYSRGIHGRWETRSSGRSDKDSDSHSDWDSDSGKRYGNQSLRSGQGPEHDGLLGSGSFPRPSGYAPGLSAPKFRLNDNYQLNRSNEPYHPPRPYKAAPHSRRDTDTFNDETFGSSECTSEDRAEDERKRRASFELMRKEQQKAFQEKQKLNPEKNKDEFDITLLLNDSKDEKRLVSRSNESVELLTPLTSNNDSEKSSFPIQNHAASRPLVPPGFTSPALEKNLLTKSSVPTHAPEVGHLEPGGTLFLTKGSHVLTGTSENQVKNPPAKQTILSEQQHGSPSLHASINNEKEKIPILSSVLDVPNKSIGMDDQLNKTSTPSKAFEALVNNKVTQLNAVVKGTDIIGDFTRDHRNSDLEKVFTGALALNGDSSTNFIEHDKKADETRSPHTFQSSKFAQWFIEEEMKPADSSSSGRPNDLLSLLVGDEKSGLQVPGVKNTERIRPELPFQSSETVGRHMASTSVSVGNSEQFYKSDKPEVVQAVLTCEDLEHSILSEISENGSTLQQPILDRVFDAKTDHANANIDNNASHHLLALLQKGTCQSDVTPSPILDIRSSDKIHKTEGGTISVTLDSFGEGNADASNPPKTLTLETLFGTAFMKELQSVGAPVSVQRGSVGSARVDVLEPHRFPFPIMDNGLPPTGELGPNRHGRRFLASNQMNQDKSDRIEDQLFGYDDFRTELQAQNRSESCKLSDLDGPAEIHLPEEDSLISVVDPLRNIISAGNSAKSEFFSSETPGDFTEKLAASNPARRDGRPIVGSQEGPSYPRAPYDIWEPDIPYQNLNVQRSSPQLHPSQLNHMRPMFNPLDSHPHVNPHMKFLTPEGIIHHGSPTNHQLPGNVLRPPFHHPSSGLTGFDPPAHNSMSQIQRNFPPAHLVRGFPRGTPLPAHPNNQISGFIQEPNPVQGFPYGHPTFGGPGMPLPADASDVRNHPEALQMLMEMELRSKSKQTHPFAAGGHSQGMYGHELDLGFRKWHLVGALVCFAA
ncbi:Serine-rich adhesin for platelets like [Quillaja saponaria]|uniref:Serine-rich adhesin for platelets like n=1 Tax=Quillaja saponaria TaxID=32244 RepID=A0AAD7L460_QUISA|nr:Serine-rich adhesin for platelets like [Quillaja saponaria]